MKTNPVKGTADFLPEETQLRDRMQSVILDTYVKSGYQHILTPILEDIENLDKSEGGDNLNLIFRVLKRGEKFEEAFRSGDEKALCDMGLRYDLTLPLCRFFSANRASLPYPFKAIQIDRVYRAERPQKGRMREFVQCDIDILGDPSPVAELDLIQTTACALGKLGLGEFTVRISDRRILRSVLSSMGFEEKDLDTVCVSFDKLDKIGKEGVTAELGEKDISPDTVRAFGHFLDHLPQSPEDALSFGADREAVESLRGILDAASALSDGTWDLRFDLSLVRGQGYYTGTVFEIESREFRGALAGGGRYDRLVGKFIGESVPAVGFSIGFERIFSILRDKKETDGQKKAVIFYKGDKPAEALNAFRRAASLRGEWEVSVAPFPKKLGKALAKYGERGFSAFMTEGEDEDLRPLR